MNVVNGAGVSAVRKVRYYPRRKFVEFTSKVGFSDHDTWVEIATDDLLEYSFPPTPMEARHIVWQQLHRAFPGKRIIVQRGDACLYVRMEPKGSGNEG